MANSIRSDHVLLERFSSGVVFRPSGMFYPFQKKVVHLPDESHDDSFKQVDLSNSNVRFYVDNVTIEMCLPVVRAIDYVSNVEISGSYINTYCTFLRSSVQNLYGIVYNGTQICPSIHQNYVVQKVFDTGFPLEILTTGIYDIYDTKNYAYAVIEYAELDI